MKKRDEIRIEVQSDPRLLRAVRALAGGYLGSLDMDAERVNEIVLAVDEACTNAIRHSYGGRKDGLLTLTFRHADDTVEIELCDEGKPVPAECLTPRELQVTDLSALKPGGLGLSLMRQAFDEVEFCPGEEKGNRVTMRLKLAVPDGVNR
ncbi:MAG: serine/threonine-protein kinase RsbW [Candidatus Hydrogenedentes bacterium]|nr:serine/threonine-protein kinase RsbW [Candidatus Hydrogenedentota bacterium]